MSEPGEDVVERSGRWKSRIAVLAVSLVVLASLALVALDRLLLPGRFAVNEVVVTGRAPNVDPAAVLAAVRRVGVKSWFSADLASVERAVRDVPWVYRATVRRRWPGKLVVSVSQANPFARYDDDTWINRQGETLSLPADFAGDDLPRLSGPPNRAADVASMYVELRALMAHADTVQVQALSLDPRGTWTLGITGASDEPSRVIHVTVGREQVVERVGRLAAALDTELAARLSVIAAIDLRYPNGFAVRPVDEPDDERRIAELKRPVAGGGTG